MKKKIDLTECLKQYPIKHSAIEEKSGVPKGTVAQNLHSRKVSLARLKVYTKAIRELGKEMINIELKGYEDQSKV